MERGDYQCIVCGIPVLPTRRRWWLRLLPLSNRKKRCTLHRGQRV